MFIFDINNYLLYFLYGWLATILITTSITDILYRKIPNVLTCPTIVLALLIHCFVGGSEGFLYSLYGLVTGFAVFFVPYLMGGMGAGDVKLMCAVGAVIGFRHTLMCTLFIAVVGGILALSITLFRGTIKQTFSKILMSLVFLVCLKDTSLMKFDKGELMQDGIPFGIAITSGVFLFLTYTIITRQSLPYFVLL